MDPSRVPAFLRQGAVAKKNRSNKQRNANRRRGNANRELSRVLKERGVKATLKARHNLRKWRSEGKNNAAFFAQYEGSRPSVPPVPFNPPTFVPAPTPAPAPAPRKFAMINARKTFKNRQLAQRAANISQYRVWKQQNPELENNTFFSSKQFKPPAESTRKRWMKTGYLQSSNIPSVVPTEPKVARVLYPLPSEVEESSVPTTLRPIVTRKTGHVEAGKKAATSEKGRAWLDDVRRAKNILDKVLAEAGSPSKATQMEARKAASELRKGNPGAINTIVAQKTSRGIQTNASVGTSMNNVD